MRSARTERLRSSRAEPPAAAQGPARVFALDELVPQPFRRRPQAPLRRRPRRTWRQIARALLALVLFVGLAGGGAWWVLRSTAFELRGIDVRGARQIEKSFVEQRLAAFQGRNLVLLTLGDVRSALEGHPWLSSVRLRKQLPDRLEIEVSEYRPVACLRAGPGWFYVADDGRVIRTVPKHLVARASTRKRVTPCELGARESNPPARGGGGLALFAIDGRDALASETPSTLIGSVPEELPGAIAVVEELSASAPEWSRRILAVKLLGRDDYALRIRGLPFELRLERGTVASRVSVARALLPQIQKRYESLLAIDLRFERRLVLTGAELRQQPEAEEVSGREGVQGCGV